MMSLKFGLDWKQKIDIRRKRNFIDIMRIQQEEEKNRVNNSSHGPANTTHS